MENVKGVKLQNVVMNKTGSKITLTFDLSKNEGYSSTGKSTLVSSSHGNMRLTEDSIMNYNIYRSLPKEERAKAKKASKASKAKAKEEPEISPEILAAITKLIASQK